MGRNKKEKTYIKSIRINQEIKDFLSSLDNTNIFVLQLLKESKEFNDFIKNQHLKDNGPKLF